VNPQPEQDWVAIAILGRVRGTRGELTAIPLSSHPERFQQLQEVFLFGDGSRFEVESVWQHDNRLIFKFRGIDSIADAEPLSGAEVRIPIGERLTLEPGEFYESDLIGCEVIERSNGAPLGRVTGFANSGGPGLLEVEGGILIPFARSICVEINTAAKKIVVELPEGLKDLNQS
jgi:16S rRNA processing protein RimM